MNDPFYRKVFLILQIATVCVFVGRAWQHLIWDAPFRTLLWDENWMRGIVEGILGMTWKEYVTSPGIDSGIQTWIRLTGAFYVICALAAVYIRRLGNIAKVVLIIGGINLIFLAALECKEKFFFLGQFLEYTLQWGSPFFLLWVHKKQQIGNQVIFLMKVAIALTFTCHGLYAIGYYPRPGYFIEMVINITGLQQDSAILFLNIAGILDFLISVLIFIPGFLSIGASAYALLWGFGTTIARVWAYFHLDTWVDTLILWLHQSVFRFPHFLIPLIVLLFLWGEYQNREKG